MEPSICNWCKTEPDMGLCITTGNEQSEAIYMSCADCLLKAFVKVLGEPASPPLRKTVKPKKLKAVPRRDTH